MSQSQVFLYSSMDKFQTGEEQESLKGYQVALWNSLDISLIVLEEDWGDEE
jgi:hypothetical protein